MAESPRSQTGDRGWVAPLLGALRSEDARALQQTFSSLSDYIKELERQIGATTYSLNIGTVSTGTPSAATITGAFPNQTLNLTLEQGPTGPTGPTGATGATGIAIQATAPANTSILWADTTIVSSGGLLPAGGTVGQVLAKSSSVDYATSWYSLWEDDQFILASRVFG